LSRYVNKTESVGDMTVTAGSKC